MDHVKIISFSLLGGVIAWFLLLLLPGNGSLIFNLIRSDLVNYLGDESALAPTPTIISPDFWQKIVSDHALSTVAIQSFRSGEIIREGSGIIISSDGVIITTFDVISNADTLQVFYKDKILRAQVVKYDSFKNLALIKPNVMNIDVARFDRNYQFQPGQDIIISGQLIELSNPIVFVQKGVISYVLSKNVILDTKPSYFLSGSRVISNSGIVIGMTYLRNKSVYLITAEMMDDFVKNYFESL